MEEEEKGNKEDDEPMLPSTARITPSDQPPTTLAPPPSSSTPPPWPSPLTKTHPSTASTSPATWNRMLTHRALLHHSRCSELRATFSPAIVQSSWLVSSFSLFTINSFDFLLALYVFLDLGYVHMLDLCLIIVWKAKAILPW